MLFPKANAKKGFGKCFKTASILLLLFLYTAGNVQLESFHSVFHSLEKALHSAEQEKDPCHRAIYHDAKDEGCDHKTHVTAVKECPLCHVVPFNDQLLTSDNTFESISFPDLLSSNYAAILVANSADNLPARAPPVA
jgi:hypothetical protein